MAGSGAPAGCLTAFRISKRRYHSFAQADIPYQTRVERTPVFYRQSTLLPPCLAVEDAHRSCTHESYLSIERLASRLDALGSPRAMAHGRDRRHHRRRIMTPFRLLCSAHADACRQATCSCLLLVRSAPERMLWLARIHPTSAGDVNSFPDHQPTLPMEAPTTADHRAVDAHVGGRHRRTLAPGPRPGGDRRRPGAGSGGYGGELEPGRRAVRCADPCRRLWLRLSRPATAGSHPGLAGRFRLHEKPSSHSRSTIPPGRCWSRRLRRHVPGAGNRRGNVGRGRAIVEL